MQITHSDLFRGDVLFGLTGAGDIQSNFVPGGAFCLMFRNRGAISGQFSRITADSVMLDWNVAGFQRPDETGTAVEIRIAQNESGSTVHLEHRAFPAKSRQTQSGAHGQDTR